MGFPLNNQLNKDREKILTSAFARGADAGVDLLLVREKVNRNPQKSTESGPTQALLRCRCYGQQP